MKDRSTEEYYMDDRCLGCGHPWEFHFVNDLNKQIWCGLEDMNMWSCPCKNFVLDNLRHIEILAEEKGLV